MSTFPTIIDSFTTHANGDVIQPAYDNAQQVALVALETKVGINASADSTTLDYKLSGVIGSDKSASLAGTENLTNKTLGAGSKILLGSDATLDLHYNSGSGTLARLPVGTGLQQLRVNSGATALEYFTPAAQADASYAAKGVVEFLTDAATSGITVASGIANVNSGTSANQIVKLDGSAKLPAVDGSALTKLAVVTKNGSTTKDASDASTTQNIAHGLGYTPHFVRITAYAGVVSETNFKGSVEAHTVYNGSTQSSYSVYSLDNTQTMTSAATFTLNTANAAGTQSGVVTFDGTNIIITWTKTSSPAGVYTLIWEAY